jgi:hypothetical protein
MSEILLQAPECISLYEGTDSHIICLEEIAGYLSEKVPGIKVEVKSDPFQYVLSKHPAAEKDAEIRTVAAILAKGKIRNLYERETPFEPLPGEIRFEEKWLLDQGHKPQGVFYDGIALADVYFSALEKGKGNFKNLHIVFTKQLFGTWDNANRRYHARVSLYGEPCILSTTGAVEAPAKPRGFYFEKRQGVDVARLKHKFKDKFLDYGDSRLTEVLKGYALQALFYFCTGNPFCEDTHCRLFNAHWQEDLIRSQLCGEYELCPSHDEMLMKIRSGSP